MRPKPAALCSRWWFSRTADSSSPTDSPRFREENGPPDAPPVRTENPCATPSAESSFEVMKSRTASILTARDRRLQIVQVLLDLLAGLSFGSAVGRSPGVLRRALHQHDALAARVADH